MQVCEVCGSLLVMNDDPKRMELHLSGKQHVGFQRVRKTLEEFRVSDGCIIDSLANVWLCSRG